MIPALIALQAVTLIVVVMLLLRKNFAVTDARVSAMAESMPLAMASLQTRVESVDGGVRAGLTEIRREMQGAAQMSDENADREARALREEIAGSIGALGKTLHDGLNGFRTDNAESDERLRLAVHAELQTIGNMLAGFIDKANRQNIDSRDVLHGKLTELTAKNVQGHDGLRESLQSKLNDLRDAQTMHQDKLRTSMEERLGKLNADNTAKLEEMRQTVDEKLHATLQTRLTESFGQVTTHLGEVQKGLGEMKELATGVGDLKKVLSNVKSRGVVGEFQLGMQLEQMFSVDQYVKNARIKPNTTETVEYALKFPNGESGHVLLPIDAKFPKEDWERLEHAYDHGTAEEIARAGTAFERAIRTEGKRICEKYIDEPTTMPHAIMFLPTENLYAEVVRRPGLQSELQQRCRVTIAGPSTFMAILTSFQMGFHTMAIQKKGTEVWKVLSATKNEFEKFGGLMDKVEKQVGTVQSTLGEINRKTKTLNRTMRDVGRLDTSGELAPLLAFEEIAGVAPMLAAVEED